MFLKKSAHREHGDTIVEVLICLAIVGATLVVSYSIAQRSQYQIRDAEERGQALKVAESQLDLLKLYIANNPSLAFASNITVKSLLYNAPGFCIINETTIRGQFTDPKTTKCAVDENGKFYPGASTDNDVVNNLGYPYRVGVFYNPATPGEFYILAGRYTAGGSKSNSENFSVETLMYRQNK